MSTIGTVKIIQVRYLEDEVYEGSIPRKAYDNATVTEYAVEDVAEAVRAIVIEGLTFAATGNDWAANPDGSYCSNYATGERTETTAHIEDFSDEDAAAIMEQVG